MHRTLFFFFSSRRRHTRCSRDWSSDVCSSDLGGRAEIIDAMRTIAEEVKQGKLETDEINEETVEEHLYTSHLPQSDPDLIIRTSGEERLSGFLLWQGAYSALCL